MRKNNKFQEVWELLNKTDNSWRIGSLSTVHDILGQIWDVNFEDLMETRESEHSRDVLERIRVCEKSSLIILNLVFFFKCQMISSSSSNVWVVLPISMFRILFPFSSHGRCLAQVLVSRSHQSYCVPDFFWSAFFSQWIFLLYLVFSIFMVYCIVVRVLFESYPIKLLKKINRRSVPSLSRAHLGQLNIVWSQDKLSHRKLQGRYPITRFQFLQISQHYIDRRNQQIMQICSQ